MPCHLHVRLPEGARALADRLTLDPYTVTEKGEENPRRPGRRYEEAYLSFDVSEADFDQLPQQFEEATSFLKKHEADVVVLASAGEAVLDFGYEPRDVSVQVDRLPRDLVELEAVFKVKLPRENERECCLQGARSSRSASYGDAAER